MDLHGWDAFEGEVASFMQGTTSSRSQPKGWYTLAKEGFSGLEARGLHKCAALRLRDLLRAECHPQVCKQAREYVQACWASPRGVATDAEMIECQEWAEGVLEHLRGLVSITCAAGNPPGPSEAQGSDFPHGLFHAVPVWPGGSQTAAGSSVSHGAHGSTGSALVDADQALRSSAADETEIGGGGTATVEEDTDETGLLAVGQALLFLPLGARAFDPLIDDEDLPIWFHNQVDTLKGLSNRGAHGPTLCQYLEGLMVASDDLRFVNDMGPVVNAIRYRVDTHTPTSNALTRADGVPREQEWQAAVKGVFAVIRERWLWKLCPTAMWNQRHERHLAEMGYCNVEFSPEHYVGEEHERRELSRSRSPHRRDRQPWKQNEDWTSWSTSSGSDAGDASSLMETQAMARGGKPRHGSRSRGRGGDRHNRGGEARNRPRGEDYVRRRVLQRVPHRVRPGPSDAHGGGRRRDPRLSARPLPSCRQVPRIRFPGLVPAQAAASSAGAGVSTPSFDVVDAMNAWRRLLGHASPGHGELTIENGGPVISDRTYRDILHDLRGRVEQDRLMMSVAVVSYIRALMVELGEACHEACLTIQDVEPEDEEVEIQLDDEDVGLMQTDIAHILQDSDEDRWARLRTRLQKELAMQPKGRCAVHVSALLCSLRRCQDLQVQTGYGAQLEAALVVMSQDALADGLPMDDAWVMDWTGALDYFVQGLHGDPGPAPVVQVNDSITEADLLQAGLPG